MLAGALCGMTVIHLVMLGVLGELVINNSDLSHTQMPEITKKQILANNGEKDSKSTEETRYIAQSKISISNEK